MLAADKPRNNQFAFPIRRRISHLFYKSKVFGYQTTHYTLGLVVEENL